MKAMDRHNEILPGIRRQSIDFDGYRKIAREADIALFEPTSPVMRLIAAGTEGPFSHAAGIFFMHDRLWQGAYTLPEPCLTPLASQVRRHSGKISIFRVRTLDDEQRKAIVHHFLSDLGGDYGLRSIGFFLMGYLAVPRFLMTLIPALRDRWLAGIEKASRKHSSAICSQHIARAVYRGTGIRLVTKELANVSPNDIGRSSAVTYVGSLLWPQSWQQ